MTTLRNIGLALLGIIVIESLMNLDGIRRYVRISRM